MIGKKLLKVEQILIIQFKILSFKKILKVFTKILINIRENFTKLCTFPYNRFSFSKLYKLNYRVKNFITKPAKIWGGGGL